ncbi:MAG: hypothetical protein IPQ07_40200 [Myxococcales bacterium]|nr:hypothetical protein [Myxococcales bacterium]
MWRNGVGGARIAANLAYLALVMGYVGLVVAGPRLDTPSGHMIQVVGQKTVAYGSMLHVIFLATTTRRALRRIAHRRAAMTGIRPEADEAR